MASPDLIPPAELITEHSGGISTEQFIAMGDEIVKHSLIGAAQLRPNGKILDIGCGCGKIARPLVPYLTQEGRYDGIDITHAAIDWCQLAYQGFGNFKFHLADLQSSRYNASGVQKASNYRFPFESATYDVIFLGSVFTHMIPEDASHYINEIGRVLKPGGKCLATFFVLDDESRRNVLAKKTTPTFSHRFGEECRVESEAVPESAIAYDETLIRKMYSASGLSIDAINFGEWGRKRFIPHWQDEVWSSKPA